MAESLEVPRDEAEKKIKNLVTQFRREWRKTREKKPGNGADGSYKSQWFAYNGMLFLADKQPPQRPYDAGIQQV